MSIAIPCPVIIATKKLSLDSTRMGDSRKMSVRCKENNIDHPRLRRLLFKIITPESVQNVSGSIRRPGCWNYTVIVQRT
jgi:hypothetical protein